MRRGAFELVMASVPATARICWPGPGARSASGRRPESPYSPPTSSDPRRAGSNATTTTSTTPGFRTMVTLLQAGNPTSSPTTFERYPEASGRTHPVSTWTPHLRSPGSDRAVGRANPVRDALPQIGSTGAAVVSCCRPGRTPDAREDEPLPATARCRSAPSRG